ncbi:hypothetical protein 1 [Hubei sobemo-like virus 30]|uniref:hypothetical protein 1 n=1 Tax=Hubei sobemo-like virus 30 TaxID=1923217 RepID=UPI00090AD880|nr:hypothetical protein 1 [Hubei sobemo-like virus 30]APG75772.1 hypothetical protein 1 [Hubei sobemo-like virus 30]
MTFLLVSFLVRWAKHINARVCALVSAGSEGLYSVLDEISPSPTPEIRKQKKGKVLTVIDDILRNIDFREYMDFDWIDALVIAACSVLTLWASYMIFRVMGRNGRRIVQRLRGIQNEAMIDGSAFHAGEIPKFQIGIARSKLFVDVHVGFGIRSKNFLITPRHVLEGVDLKEVLLVGPTGKVIVSLCPQPSRLVSDLTYTYIESAIWTKLGARSANLNNTPITTMVECCGKDGKSNGRIRKTNMFGLISYTGSTLPGMSGAAYVFNNQVQGIHKGAAGRYNLGVSSAVLAAELSKLCPPTADESLPAKDAEDYVEQFQQQNTWTTQQLEKKIQEMDKYTGWSTQETMDFNQTLNWDESSPSTSDSTSGAATKSNPMFVNYVAQGILSDCKDIPTVEFTSRLESLWSQYPVILNRLCAVEKELEAIKAPKPVANCESQTEPEVVPEASKVVTVVDKTPFCFLCSKHFATENGYQHHISNSKKHTVAESAIPGDTGDKGKVVRTAGPAPFLGPATTSQKRKKTSSSKSSGRSARRNQSPPNQGHPSEMMSSLKNIELVLKNLVQVMDGQKSGKERN